MNVDERMPAEQDAIADLTIPVMTLHAVEQVAPELAFSTLEQLPVSSSGYVYAFIDEHRRIHYIGQTGGRARFANYRRWLGIFRDRAYPSPNQSLLEDPVANHGVLLWEEPILRWVDVHGLQLLAAPVENTDGSPRAWEARIQALSALLTGNESLIGGSGWEWSRGSHRHLARRWLSVRLESMR